MPERVFGSHLPERVLDFAVQTSVIFGHINHDPPIVPLLARVVKSLGPRALYETLSRVRCPLMTRTCWHAWP